MSSHPFLENILHYKYWDSLKPSNWHCPLKHLSLNAKKSQWNLQWKPCWKNRMSNANTSTMCWNPFLKEHLPFLCTSLHFLEISIPLVDWLDKASVIIKIFLCEFAHHTYKISQQVAGVFLPKRSRSMPSHVNCSLSAARTWAAIHTFFQTLNAS